MTETEMLEARLNELIAEAVKGGGHVYIVVYIVDKKQNKYSLRLEEPAKILFYGGYKGQDS